MRSTRPVTILFPCILAYLTAILLGTPAWATDYQVGPGQAYADPVSVPWESLNAGDTVYIHWRSAAQGGDYHEKVNLTRSGAPGNPIHIVGVPGPNGERPCLNGANAITRTVNSAQNSTYYTGNQARGILCFSEKANGSTTSAGASYWDVSGLKITGARPANSFTNSYGQATSFNYDPKGESASSGVFIDRGNYLHFSNMELTNNQNGFFGSSNVRSGQVPRHVHDCILEKSLLYNNGAANSYTIHNAYVELADMTYRWNYFGPLVAGSDGTHIKDRGANVLIEGNYFADANTTMYLDPPEYSEGWMDQQPGFTTITVRNNVITKTDINTYLGFDLILTGFGNGDPTHDPPVPPPIPIVRTVNVNNNTFILTCSQNTNWGVNVFDVSAYPQIINFDKNVFLRCVGAGLTPSEIRFVAKFEPGASTATVVNIGTGNYMSYQPTVYPQTSGQYANGSITVNGLSNINQLANMTQAQLESLLGINLHDPSAANYGRFSETANAWFLAHGAGAALAPLAGDANEDGTVSFADYQALEANFGIFDRTWAQGDFNGDFMVNFADYQMLETTFGQSIPEPASLTLLAAGILALAGRKRR